MNAYGPLTLVLINTVLKKDDSVKNGMLSSIGVAVAGPAQSSGARCAFWLQAMHGGRDEPELQAKYDTTTAPERAWCDWL